MLRRAHTRFRHPDLMPPPSRRGPVVIAQPEDEDGDGPTAEEMAEWFLENYEDPAQHVPYESAEGGYQYYAGGPYDSDEVLWEEFPNADEEKIREAVKLVESAGGPEWVRIGQY